MDKHLFQLYMTLEDVKALKTGVLKSSDPANELCLRADNIIYEINTHLKKYKFKPPTKSVIK